MKKQTKKNVLVFALVATLGLFSQNLMAQTPPPPPGDAGTPGTELPINGLIALGLAAGAYFGVSKLKNKK